MCLEDNDLMDFTDSTPTLISTATNTLGNSTTIFETLATSKSQPADLIERDLLQQPDIGNRMPIQDAPQSIKPLPSREETNTVNSSTNPSLYQLQPNTGNVQPDTTNTPLLVAKAITTIAETRRQPDSLDPTTTSLVKFQFPLTDHVTTADHQPDPQNPTVADMDPISQIWERLLSEHADQNKYYESLDQKNERVATQRKKEYERIQQAEERRLKRELERKPCSRNHCFTPTNSQQYSNIDSTPYFPATLVTWMKPYKQQAASRPYAVIEETTINLPRDFPYRLAWETPTSDVLDIKLYYPKKKFQPECKLSNMILDKGLQPTKSIPDKGRYILVTEPVSEPALPALSPLENRLLSVRFPKQKERILRTVFSNLPDPS
ncbi:hypothetical protein lerEdw1_014702 [Lerista edwardsae]|nr:hypothetical protein lerEdw1_014703 [Lerista edwardsae]KAJ6628659.1 hypothetical protein lerEdw1_014702 [Lerista edwardsae]